MKPRRTRPALPFAYRLAVGVIRPLLMALTKRDWHGWENLPQEGGFVVSPNHLSYADPLVFAHYVYDAGCPPYFLAKSTLFSVPVFGAILRGANQIPVHRNSGRAADALRSAVEAVHEGRCVAMYAEGTLTRDPDLWPMVGKTGAARVALTTRCPVVPMAMWGPQDILAPYAKRLRLFPRKTVHVVAGPPVDLSDLYDLPLDGRTLRLATDRITADVTTLLEGLRGESAPPTRFDSRAAGLPETGNFHQKGRKRS